MWIWSSASSPWISRICRSWTGECSGGWVMAHRDLCSEHNVRKVIIVFFISLGAGGGVALVSNLWLSLWSLELAIELHCVETTLESTLCIMNNGGPRTVASWKVKIGVQNTLLHPWERTRLANAMIKELVRQGGASFTTENLEGALFT